jgi:Mrp family chromosome partitioning ATPase
MEMFMGPSEERGLPDARVGGVIPWHGRDKRDKAPRRTREGLSMVAPIISLFNHKGGVSKTTTAFNLGWALADRGKRVLIVDGDPQCNLTGTVLGFDGIEDFAAFYKAKSQRKY